MTELQILDAIQKLRTPIGDVVMPMITFMGDNGLIWIILAGVLLIFPKTRRSGLVLAVALVLDVILCNGILKHIFARTRPCDVNTDITLLIARPNDYSFPSGHTAAAFAAVTALYLSHQRLLWKISGIIAILIAFSRMYLYVHYPTDILGGILVGILCGCFGFLIVKEVRDTNRKAVGETDK